MTPLPFSSPPLVIPPKANHTCTVIWLHGLGDTGAGWQFLAEELGPQCPSVKWILPTAPSRPVAYNVNGVIPGWFDVASGNDHASAKIDQDGMLASVQLVNDLIQMERNQGMDNIILGGFSQGCAITLLTARTTKIKLAGIIGAGGWLPKGDKILSLTSETNKQTPILLCHGDEDEVVKYQYSKATGRFLQKMGYQVDFKTYQGLGHTSSEEQMRDIGVFIQRQLVDLTSKL
ncbi:unnamed protein product [Absidia cylindrospora]